MLGSRATLKATDARNILKPVKVVLRRKDKVVKTPDELLDRQTELKGQRPEEVKIPIKPSRTLGIRFSQDSLMGPLRS
jgi:hypothetical protein